MLQDKIALITGASRGIGAAVAKRFAAEGAQVILAARTVGGLEEVDDAIRKAGGKPAVLVPLDLKEWDKIDHLGAVIGERFKRLDILVGNAAILGELSPLPHIEPKLWQEVMMTNVTANYRLLRICDPLLKTSEAGRAMFVTSGITQAAFPYWGPYAVSKSALETLVKTYAAEIAKTAVRANLIDPGIVRTHMRAAAFPGEDAMALPEPASITGTFVELALPACNRNGEIVKAY